MKPMKKAAPKMPKGMPMPMAPEAMPMLPKKGKPAKKSAKKY